MQVLFYYVFNYKSYNIFKGICILVQTELSAHT
jgi:hypothetical protein